VASQIRILFVGFAILCVALFILIFILFKDKPKIPANRASIKRSEPEKCDENSNSRNSEKFSFLASVKEYGSSIMRLMKSIPFLLLVVSYGLNVGCYYALSTLLNQIIKPTFLRNEADYSEEFLSSLDTSIGSMGTMMVVAGLVGSLLGGFLLDRFKKFKLTTLCCCLLTLVFMVLFSWMVYKESIAFDYFFIAALGFFMTGYLPIGFEFGAELTYPESEATSSGLLNCSAQIFGLAVTQFCTFIINSSTSNDDDGGIEGQLRGARYANISMITCLILCCILTFLIKEDLKRYKVEKERHEESPSNENLLNHCSKGSSHVLTAS